MRKHLKCSPFPFCDMNIIVHISITRYNEGTQQQRRSFYLVFNSPGFPLLSPLGCIYITKFPFLPIFLFKKPQWFSLLSKTSNQNRSMVFSMTSMSQTIYYLLFFQRSFWLQLESSGSQILIQVQSTLAPFLKNVFPLRFTEI